VTVTYLQWLIGNTGEESTAQEEDEKHEEEEYVAVT